MKHAAATANTNQQNQLIQDLTHVGKLGQSSGFFAGSVPVSVPVAATSSSSESDESKLAKKLMAGPGNAKTEAELRKQAQTEAMDSTTHIYAEVGPKRGTGRRQQQQRRRRQQQLKQQQQQRQQRLQHRRPTKPRDLPKVPPPRRQL